MNEKPENESRSKTEESGTPDMKHKTSNTKQESRSKTEEIQDRNKKHESRVRNSRHET